MLRRIAVKGESYAEEIGKPIFHYRASNDTRYVNFSYIKVNGVYSIIEESTGCCVINRVGLLQKFGFESICDFIAKLTDINTRIDEYPKIHELKLWKDDERK